MMTKDFIHQCLMELNEELRLDGLRGEIGLVGGAVMCLVFNARVATRYVDAIFEPSQGIRIAAKRIALRHNLPPDWLNDGAKGFMVQNFLRVPVLNLSNLSIWAPEPRYMLAMKAIAARWDTSDKDDVIFLISHLKLKNANSVLEIIADYYPKSQIPAKTQFFIEELFER